MAAKWSWLEDVTQYSAMPLMQDACHHTPPISYIRCCDRDCKGHKTACNTVDATLKNCAVQQLWGKDTSAASQNLLMSMLHCQDVTTYELTHSQWRHPAWPPHTLGCDCGDGDRQRSMSYIAAGWPRAGSCTHGTMGEFQIIAWKVICVLPSLDRSDYSCPCPHMWHMQDTEPCLAWATAVHVSPALVTHSVCRHTPA